MEKVILKRKIYKFKTLGNRLVHRKIKLSPFVQVKPERIKKREAKKLKKDKNIGSNISSTVRLFCSRCY